MSYVRPALVALVAISVACGSSPASPAPSPPVTPTLSPVQDSAEWPASTPLAEGLDEARLAALAGRIRRGDYGFINSLLVTKNGRLIVEEYFNGWSRTASHTQQSVTKSVASLALGLAVDRGLLRLSDRVTPFFAEYEPLGSDSAHKRAMRMEDLIGMASGLDWNEDIYTGSPLQRLNDCRCDWPRFVLDWPMREAPGTRWEYISGGTILAGAAIGKAAGMRVDEFLDLHLFRPLGFGEVRWGRGLPDGLPHMGGGLALTPRDMAKLGSLVIDDGMWRGARILSASWMRTSTAERRQTGRVWAGRPAGYGLSWWTLPDDIVVAAGARGQWIFALRRHRAVVVSTAENAADFTRQVQFLYSDIIPALDAG